MIEIIFAYLRHSHHESLMINHLIIHFIFFCFYILPILFNLIGMQLRGFAQINIYISASREIRFLVIIDHLENQTYMIINT